MNSSIYLSAGWLIRADLDPSWAHHQRVGNRPHG
jgi:hypothetical protein